MNASRFLDDQPIELAWNRNKSLTTTTARTNKKRLSHTHTHTQICWLLRVFNPFFVVDEEIWRLELFYFSLFFCLNSFEYQINKLCVRIHVQYKKRRKQNKSKQKEKKETWATTHWNYIKQSDDFDFFYNRKNGVINCIGVFSFVYWKKL